MLISGAQLLGTPVMSLQTGKEIAVTDVAIINPHNLTVIAYRLRGKHLDFDPAFVRIADVREIGNIGMIVDSSDELIGEEDIVTDKPIYEMSYELQGKLVIDDRKKKMGKVDDYILDIDSFTIQKIAVHRPLLHSFKDAVLLVHRGQIVEVTDDCVVIQSGSTKHKSRAKGKKNYVNPFRQSTPQPETIKMDNKR